MPLKPTLFSSSPTVQRSLREYTVNGHTFHMAQVQKGRFWMGDDYSKYPREKLAHWVDIAQDFELGQYLVTQALWEAVMGENPSYFQGADRPVENVSWDDIMGTEKGVKKGNAKDGFLDRLNGLPEITALNEKDGSHFALPSEAQWEYAARGGCYGAVFPYEYAGSNYLPEVGWYDDNSQQQTQPVGRKRPNALGLYDMSGNVREWCEDDWHFKYNGAPTGGRAWVDSPRGSLRVHRGGSWSDNPRFCHVAYRDDYWPTDRLFHLGFRLARSSRS